MSTTHPHNPFCTVGLYQEKKSATGRGWGRQTKPSGNKHMHIHTLTRARNNERHGKIFITFPLAFPLSGRILDPFYLLKASWHFIL